MEDTDRNNETEQILDNENIVKYVKSCRIGWLDHVERMDEERLPNVRCFQEWKEPEGKDVQEVDEVKKDLQQMEKCCQKSGRVEKNRFGSQGSCMACKA